MTTGVSKCRADSTTCFQFRVPPAFAQNLVDAGFNLMNQANNHAADYGEAGFNNTRHSLEAWDSSTPAEWARSP